MTKQIYILLSFIFISSAYSFQDNFEDSKSIHKSEGFTIKIPNDWIEIPSDILNERTEESKKSFKYKGNTTFNYAFQNSSSIYWFEHPYIIISVDSAGRVSESELKNLENLNNKFKNGLDEFLQLSNDRLKGANLSKPLYDSINHILWLRIETSLQDIGDITGITGMKLTESGMIKISCYSMSNEYDFHSSLFKKIILSCKVDEKYKYKESESISYFNNINWPKVIAYSIIGALIALLYPYLKKKKAGLKSN